VPENLPDKLYADKKEEHPKPKIVFAREKLLIAIWPGARECMPRTL
jgi:hypothetical protein